MTNQLNALLMQMTVATDNLDLCRLGVSLSGFCYRSTPQVGIPFINSIFNDLAAHGVTDLQAENEFRRAVGLSEVCEDRSPRSISDPAPVPLLVLEDVTASRNQINPFAPYVGDMTDYRDLVLGCVFRRFDVTVPPAESDAAQYPELVGLKKKLRTSFAKATKSFSSGTGGGRLRKDVDV